MNPLRWARAELLHLAWKRGVYLPPDRELLETILPVLGREPGVERVLSVGVAWYTQSYERLTAVRTFVTVDHDPARASFGVPGRHIIAELTDLESVIPESEPFDVIVMNGVIGFGLDTPEDIERGLRACAARLRPRGTLLLGMNLQLAPLSLTSIVSGGLFEPRAFGEWADGRVTVEVPFRERTHTFVFLRRR